MKQELIDLLAEHLGELMYQLEKCHDWMESDLIKKKINAIEELLGVKKSNFEFTLDEIRKIIEHTKP